MSNFKLCVTILAAGNGKRMNSTWPKVLHQINNQPMLVKLINTVIQLKPNKILVIVNPNTINNIKDILKEHLPQRVCNDLIFVIQDVPNGTGDAVLKSIEFLNICKKLDMHYNMILNGDMPCLEYSTLVDIYEYFLTNYKTERKNLQIVGINLVDPKSNGRIIRENNIFGTEYRIIETRDCTDQQKLITLINTGIYIADIDLLTVCVPKISNKNQQNEYYLTDIVRLAYNHKCNVILLMLDDSKSLEISNINTKEELDYVNNQLII